MSPEVELAVIIAAGLLSGFINTLASSGSAVTLVPSMNASPWSGFNTVYNMRSVVDLPAPFGPNNPVICPSRAEKLTPRTAATLPKDLNNSRASSI